jgi:hypothetical protein
VLPRRPLALAAFALIAVALTGCAPPSEQARASATPTPIFATDADALAAATKAYARYLTVTEEVMRGGKSYKKELTQVASGTELSTDLSGVQSWKAAKSHLKGSASFADATLVRLKSSPNRSEITIRLCEDISSVEVTGPDGASLVRADRRASTRYEVKLVSDRNSRQLKVTDRRAISDLPC